MTRSFRARHPWRNRWREWRLRIFTGSFPAATNFSIDFTDRTIEGLERRISDLEEIVAAGWPRGMILRRRLRRELRASVARLGDLPDFRTRRSEAFGLGLTAEDTHRQGKAGAALCRPGGPFPLSAC